MFLTGPGGSGKTTLVRDMYHNTKGKKIQVVAMTGCAAVLLGCKARTVHSFAGIGLGSGTIQENIERVKRNRKKVNQWKAVDILVVDEVSMMSRKLFETLDAVARECRRSDRPFGGMQVVFSGDFYQIRPIGNAREPSTLEFCFESPLWKTTFGDRQICLKTIFRQQNDPVFTRILNMIRDGTLDSEGERVISSLIVKERSGVPTRIFPLRRNADGMNSRELDALPKESEHRYEMKDELDLPMTLREMETRDRVSPSDVEAELQSMRKNLMCDHEVVLRTGARVMCVVNIELPEKKYLCNGSQGVVQGFDSDGYPFIRFDNGIETVLPPHVWKSETIPGIGISQIPLILAWAITIHKAQGSTMDCAEIDVGGSIFECGQTYVALSRLRSMKGLYLTSFDPQSIYVNPRVREFYRNLETS